MSTNRQVTYAPPHAEQLARCARTAVPLSITGLVQEVASSGHPKYVVAPWLYAHPVRPTPVPRPRSCACERSTKIEDILTYVDHEFNSTQTHTPPPKVDLIEVTCILQPPIQPPSSPRDFVPPSRNPPQKGNIHFYPPQIAPTRPGLERMCPSGIPAGYLAQWPGGRTQFAGRGGRDTTPIRLGWAWVGIGV
ncbi:uncharacterized protein N7482_004750 [Penicillium canariense]|uniref:Uncharacterized protein n=1 Tax=Penicillium canariense TaxID=189055 RepID=A0A9W9I9J2_9EURO|nr:uncharacterized protein N7482_004750 [Penicillium canariense]KAJ5169156.1 hypothetical protein N7482_004750 [Penicillium canariense]